MPQPDMTCIITSYSSPLEYRYRRGVAMLEYLLESVLE